MAIESVQVKLMLTKDKNVLAQLKKNGCLFVDPKDNLLTWRAQFDSQIFYFKEGIPTTVAETVAQALRRSSAVIVGEPIDGEFMPGLIEICRYKLGEMPPDEGNPMTVCNVCRKDLKSIELLADHLLKTHSTANIAEITVTERAKRLHAEALKA